MYSIERPICKDCKINPVQQNDKALPDGRGNWKIRCQNCHRIHFAGKQGKTPRDWQNSFHPYLKYRKNYCENNQVTFWADLEIKSNKVIKHPYKGLAPGFICTATIPISALLQVDHIDGNPTNHTISNLQTLCSNCHTFKTLAFGDAHTIGRKQSKIAASKYLK